MGTLIPQNKPMMNLIIWNARGANSAAFKRHCKALINLHNSVMLVLLETKIADHAKITDELGFESFIQSAAEGLCRGIVIMWRNDLLTLKNMTVTTQSIHVMIKVSPHPTPWLFSALYASNDFHSRTTLWDSLLRISQNYDGPWLIGGDLNEVLSTSNKLGGRPVNVCRANLLRQCLNQCGMIDLGYKGSRYTWTNKRYQSQKDTILERLDRCLANDKWVLQYQESSVLHLSRTKSDLCPMKVQILNPRVTTNEKPFRFEPMWCSHPDFEIIIQHSFVNQYLLTQVIQSFQSNISDWNKRVFGNIFKKMRTILARLAGIQNSSSYTSSSFLRKLETDLLLEYDSLLKNEEVFWKVKSRIGWLTGGDANTRFFHISTINRRRRNRISSLKDEAGNDITNPRDIKQHIISFFTNLFTTSHSQAVRTNLGSPSAQNTLPPDISTKLDAPLENLEILKALKFFHPLKASGPDGLHPMFYQNYWEWVGEKTMDFCRTTFLSNTMNPEINATLL